MQPKEVYKLNLDTVGVVADGQRRTTKMIPKDSRVTVVNGPLDGERMIDVSWNGQTLMIFTQDLRERGELVNGAAE